MDIFQQVHLAMNSVGPLGGFYIVNEYAQERVWHIAVDTTTELIAELAEPRNSLVLSFPLGKPVNPSVIYELALKYADMWDLNEGSRLGLDAEGSLTLISETNASCLTGETLAVIIAAATERAQAWKRIISGESKTSDETLSVMSSGSYIQI